MGIHVENVMKFESFNIYNIWSMEEEQTKKIVLYNIIKNIYIRPVSHKTMNMVINSRSAGRDP